MIRRSDSLIVNLEVLFITTTITTPTNTNISTARYIIYVVTIALFDISISNIDCQYIDIFEKYQYRY